MVKEVDCVELGLACAETCQALDRVVSGREQEQLSQLVLEAVGRLNMCVDPMTYTPGDLLIIGLLR